MNDEKEGKVIFRANILFILAVVIVITAIIASYKIGKSKGFELGSINQAFWSHSGDNQKFLMNDSFHRHMDLLGNDLAKNTKWNGFSGWEAKIF